MEAIHLSRVSNTRSIFHSRSWINGRRKGTKKKEYRQSSSHLLIRSTAMQTKQNLLQMSRNQEKYSIKFIGDLNEMQCIGFTCPQHKMLVTNFGRQVLTPLLRTSLCVVKGCQRKWKERIVRQTNYPSKRTKSNTLTIMGSCEIQQIARASGNREHVADVDL